MTRVFYSSTLTKGKKLENYNWHEKWSVAVARSLLVLQLHFDGDLITSLLENVTTLTHTKKTQKMQSVKAAEFAANSSCEKIR